MSPEAEPPPLAPPPGAAKEPVVALILSLCFPGAGYAYAERPGTFARVAFVTGALYFLACSSGFPIWVPVLVHVFNAVASAGAVKERNRRLGHGPGVMPPPPPPPPSDWDEASEEVSEAVSEEAPEEAPVDAAVPPPLPSSSSSSSSEEPPPPGPLGTDAFLAELQAAWRENRAGTLNDFAFARRKQEAIQRLRFEDEDDRAAVLEAAVALVDGGVLTSGERRRIEAKGTRR